MLFIDAVLGIESSVIFVAGIVGVFLNLLKGFFREE